LVQLTGFQGAVSTKPLISGVPGYMHVLRLMVIILNICYRPLLISVVT